MHLLTIFVTLVVLHIDGGKQHLFIEFFSYGCEKILELTLFPLIWLPESLSSLIHLSDPVRAQQSPVL